MPLDTVHDFRQFACSHCGRDFLAPVSCGNRFCPVCSGRKRRRLRAQLRAVLATLPAARTFPVRFLTLTVPVNPELRNTARVLIASLRRLRQRKWWKSRVRGGCYVLEVAGRPGAWHLHLHVIIEGTFLPKRQLSAEWAKVSPGRIVRVRAFPPAVIAGYITKYITKSALSPSLQSAASGALQSARLFAFFGSWLKVIHKVKSPPAVCPSCGYDCWIWMDDPQLKVYNAQIPPHTWPDSGQYRNTG